MVSGRGGSPGEMRTKKSRKPKHHEPVVAEERSGRRKKKKVVTMRLSHELIDYIHTREIFGYIVTDWLGNSRRSTLPLVSVDEFLGRKLAKRIAAQAYDNADFDAYVLYQFRAKGYVEIDEEVTDDEEK